MKLWSLDWSCWVKMWTELEVWSHPQNDNKNSWVGRICMLVCIGNKYIIRNKIVVIQNLSLKCDRDLLILN